ncbi:MAG TPA: hypothetical protein VEK74_03280 [Burkholderiaceae bacterium]|nr:hypothetical protein [Burkholderiaceae bacterium]
MPPPLHLDMQGYNIVLWISLAMLLLSLLVWAGQRRAAARARAERARREAERPQLGGDSYFLPPAPIEQAVELATPVEIESLLAGESETVAAAARRQLEEATDIAITGGLRELSLSVPGAPRPPMPNRPTQPLTQTNGLRELSLSVPGAPRAAARPSQARSPAGRPTAAAATSAAVKPLPAHDNQFRIPVRELVLAWFEARGYRASTAFSDAHPIELVLHHRKDQGRSYAFVVESALVTSARASSLHAQARAAGLPRLLIAAESGTEEDLPKRVQRLGIRVFDERGIRAQLGKIDIRIAAKIIAVARGRGLARRTAAAAAAARARQPPGPGNSLAAAKL